MRLLTLVLMMLPLAAAASPLPDFPFVYVYGTANREIAPDKAIVSFRVKSYDALAERAYGRQSECADAIIAFAEKLGVQDSDIVGQAIEKSTVRREDDKGKEFEIIGYEAVRTVRIELRDLSRFSQLIEFLYTQPNVENISATFGCKDETTILQSLTEEACRAATANAQRLSRGFERKLGSVRAVSETGFAGMGGPFGFPGESYGYAASAALTAKRDFRVIPSTISFRKGIFVIFALE